MQMLRRKVRAGSEKARIWQICDELLAERGAVPSGRDVVDIYVAEGGNEGTGFTQYSHWKKQFLAGQAASDDFPLAAPGSVTFRPMTVSADGSLALPPDVRRAMLLDGDGRVTVGVVDGELRVLTPMAAVRMLQHRAERLAPKGALVSDELVAERRAEADIDG